MNRDKHERNPVIETYRPFFKTAIVTGGAVGIGLGIARRLAEAGANIVIVDIDEKAGNASVAQLQNNGSKAMFVKTDVSIEKDVQAAVDFSVDTYGSLDIRAYNAGIYQLSLWK